MSTTHKKQKEKRLALAGVALGFFCQFSASSSFAASPVNGLASESEVELAVSVQRPEIHAWAKWRKGAWVDLEISGNSELKLRRSLHESGEKTYKIRTRSEAEGRDAQESLYEYGYPFQGGAHLATDAEKVGSEALTIDGRRFVCTKYRARWKVGQSSYEDTVWVAPGRDLPLKIESTSPREHIELTALHLSERFEVGKHNLDCVVYRGELTQASKVYVIEQWRSLAVPGGLARQAVFERDQPFQTPSLTEVVDFQGWVETRHKR